MKRTILLFLFSLFSFGSVIATAPDKNDTLFDKLWGLKNSGQTILRRSGDLTREEIKGIPGVDINWVDLKDLPVASNIPSEREIVVAVLDYGIDKEHPDLKDRIFFDKKLCPNSEDKKEKPCSGINVLKKNLEIDDDNGHGTHVAGIIAASANNQLGVTGVSDSRVKILPIKVLSQDTNEFVYEGRLITDIFADGIIFALERGAHVINMSIGWPKLVETPKMKRALQVAAQRDVVIVAAAGNNNKQIPTYPCTNETVICVGAIDNQGKITEFSNYGGKVDILAPGEFIVSTYPRESVESRILRIRGYEAKNGTSQAAPYVAAIAASLKLIDPKMSLREVKARLFSSAKEVILSKKENKFSKYGLVDMKAALSDSTTRFASPDFKNLLDLNFKVSDGSFFFGLPIESLRGEFENLSVTASFQRQDISLEKVTQAVDLRDGQRKSVLFKGKLEDLSRDSQFRLKVELKDELGFHSVTETTLIFARDLSREDGLQSELIEGFKDQDLTFFRGERKVSRLKRVQGRESSPHYPIFYTEIPSLQSDDKSVVSLMKRSHEKWEKIDLELEKRFEIVSVTNEDLDDDGHPDFLITGVSGDQKFVTFDYILQEKKITFQFPLLEYKNFPLEYNQLGGLPLVTIKTGLNDLPKLKVPTFYARYTLPEKDNSEDILDRVPEDALGNHQYYLNPINNEESLLFELRVFDSLAALEEFRNNNFIESWQSLAFDRPFPQSQKEKKRGEIKGLISVGDEFARDYFLYFIKEGELSYRRVFFPDTLLAGNNVRPLISVDDKNLGAITEKVEFLAQLQRDQVRSYVWAPTSAQGNSLLIDTKRWSDPVFNSIIAFDNEENTRLIETRYYLRAFNQDGEVGRLRINRESSFPGVQFSETLNPVIVKSKERNYPGLFINSTLIFGNRLYTMVEKGDEFIRPLGFSVDIPKQCVHMRPQVIEGSYHYVLLCRKGRGRIAIETLKLEFESN